MSFNWREQMPLWRFYLLIVLTVLLLALSLNQLYRLLSATAQPSVDARLVLDAVQQLRQHDKALSCFADDQTDCREALFIIYPREHWQGQMQLQTGQVIPLQDSEGQIQLCSVEASQELLCLNQLNWPQQPGIRLELAYLFYFLLLLSLFMISRHLFRDVQILRTSAVSEIRHGRFPAFILSPRSYLAPLAQSLRNMTRRIEELNSFQAEMAETVCHDIKTPLARLKLISHMLTPATLPAARQEIDANLREIELNIYDYLRLAQNDYLQQELELLEINLPKFCQDIIDRFRGHTAMQIRFDMQTGTTETYQADLLLLQRALSNLLSNALRFCRSEVWVELSGNAGQLRLSVSDDGPGWQSAGSGHDDMTCHHGLGLSIVRRVAEQHGGSLLRDASVTGGARCTLLLPNPPVTELQGKEDCQW